MRKVLIVDDAAFMRMSIRKLLKENGFENIEEAQNGVEALLKYKKFQPDIVTMDITMPEMSGIDTLKEIIKYDPNAKVVMISATGQEAMVMEAIMHGAKSFIIKPFKDDHVIKTLNKVLAM